MEGLFAVLQLVNPLLAFIKLHWIRVLLVSVMSIALWTQRKVLQDKWDAWNKPHWLISVLAHPRGPLSLRIAMVLVVSGVIYLLFSYQPYSYKEKGMPAEVTMSPRLKRLFEHTKIVCFGRYAMTVPKEAEVLWGSAGFPANIKIIDGGMVTMKDHIAEDIADIRSKNRTAEIVHSNKGPVPDSWQIRFYSSAAGKKLDNLGAITYLNKGELSFIYRMGDLPMSTYVAQSIHLRSPEAVPTTPGFCIDHGFIADDRYADQETIQAGIYLPSLPDVTFSVYSNKNASTKGDNGMSLLESIAAAKSDQGLAYPAVKVLREGKRHVANWKGEESLVLRPDAVHEFNWESVGKSGDVANPPWFTAKLYTKVADNRVGAADKAVLSDDETVALWDQLLDGLKFRMQVPGAPAGSYYYPAR